MFWKVNYKMSMREKIKSNNVCYNFAAYLLINEKFNYPSVVFINYNDLILLFYPTNHIFVFLTTSTWLYAVFLKATGTLKFQFVSFPLKVFHCQVVSIAVNPTPSKVKSYELAPNYCERVFGWPEGFLHGLTTSTYDVSAARKHFVSQQLSILDGYNCG